MRIAYFDCFSGASGDMSLGALLACGALEASLRAGLDSLHLPGWELEVAEVERNGIGAVDVTVRSTREEGHGRHLHHIVEILQRSGLSELVKSMAIRIFTRLADSEAKIHQTTRDRIHFHEVGAVDAIIDIVGVCLCFESLGIDEVQCAPWPMGHGFVTCAHGVIPIPAPAVLELSQGMQTYGVDVEGELLTPTGAAIMSTLSTRCGPMPAMRIESTGYGAGKKQFGNRPNLLRVVIGESEGEASEVTIIATNLDDVSPQILANTAAILMESGALDAFITPIIMKKGRPAQLLTVLAEPSNAQELAGIIFRETGTLGIRFSTSRRYCAERTWEEVQTPYGAIRVKCGIWQGVQTSAAPEFDDVAAASRAHNAPLKLVQESAMQAFRQK